MTDKTIDLILRLIYQSQGNDKAVKGAEDLDTKIKQLRQNSQELYRDAAKLQTIFTSLGVAGAGILAPLLLDAKKYADVVGYADTVSARWLDSSKKIEYANLSIGRSVESALNPALETTARIMTQLADVADQNPWLVNGALGIGAGLVGVAALGTVSANVIKGVGALESLYASLLAKGVVGGAAAGEAAAGTAAGTGAVGSLITSVAVPGAVYGGALAIGAAIGKGIGDTVNELLGRESQTWEEVGHNLQLISAGLSPLGLIARAMSAAGFKDQAQGLRGFVENINGLGTSSKPAGMTQLYSGSSGYLDTFTKSSLNDFIQYKKQLADAEKNSEEQRTAIVEQFGERRIAVEQNAEDQRLAVLKGLHKEDDKAEADLNEQRAKTVQDGGAEIQKIEQDSQRRLVEMARDHTNRLQDLTAARDALGIVKEDQRYNEQTDQERENTTTEIGRRRADLALQLADMQAAFVKQRNTRAEDAKERLAEIKAQERKELDALTDQQKKTLDKQKQGYDKQVQQMEEAFIARVNALDPSILQTSAQFQRMLESQDAEYTAWIRAHSSVYGSTHAAGEPHATTPHANPNQGMGNAQRPAIPRAAGGYAMHGLYELGEGGKDEFVLNHAATRAAEQLLGARLNQENMIAGLMNARQAERSGGGGDRMSMNATIVGRSMSYREIQDVAIKQVLPAVLDHMNRGLKQ